MGFQNVCISAAVGSYGPLDLLMLEANKVTMKW